MEDLVGLRKYVICFLISQGHSISDCEEAAQEAILRYMKNKDSVKSCKKWATTAALNYLRRQYRSAAIALRNSGKIYFSQPQPQDPLEIIIQQEMVDDASEMVRRIPGRRRHVVEQWLNNSHKWNKKKRGESMGMSNPERAMLWRAFQFCRKLYGKRFA